MVINRRMLSIWKPTSATVSGTGIERSAVRKINLNAEIDFLVPKKGSAIIGAYGVNLIAMSDKTKFFSSKILSFSIKCAFCSVSIFRFFVKSDKPRRPTKKKIISPTVSPSQPKIATMKILKIPMEARNAAAIVTSGHSMTMAPNITK